MSGLDWLIARPVAHRGLHDASAGVLENMPAAFLAAIAGNFSIECDVQLSADGEAMVHHDAVLGRLTDGAGPLRALSAPALKAVTFKATAERMLTLGELCDLVDGRVPLVVEVKTDIEGAPALPPRVAEVLASYCGPVAAMSFDPRQVKALRRLAPGLPRGIVAQRRYDSATWDRFTPFEKWGLGHLLHAGDTRPHFVAYNVHDLPAPGPMVARWLFGRPLLAWTVRTPDDRVQAAKWASQMIFEGFRP